MEAVTGPACSLGHVTPAGGANLPGIVIEDGLEAGCFTIRHPGGVGGDWIHFCDWPALKAAIDQHQRERGGRV